jgi:hypothetical protein
MFGNNATNINSTASPTLRQQFTGMFHASDTRGEGDLELHLNDAGVLTGYFAVEEKTFELKGCVSSTGNAFGFLLAPHHASPVALVRINAEGEGVSLESYLSESFDHAGPERVSFRRVMSAGVLEELFHPVNKPCKQGVQQ